MSATILILEDTATILEIESRLLREQGYNVIACSDGEEGLRLAQRLKPDLLITDAMLPGRTGFDIVQELKASPAHKGIPIFMLTSITEGTDQTDEEWAEKTGADDFLSKPFSSTEFLRRVSQLLQS